MLEGVSRPNPEQGIFGRLEPDVFARELREGRRRQSPHVDRSRSHGD